MTHATGLFFCALFLLAISASTFSGCGLRGTLISYAFAMCVAAIATIYWVTTP